MRRWLDLLGWRLVMRHGPTCRACGCAAFEREQAYDAVRCVCGHRITRLELYATSPAKVWLFGL